MNALTPFRSIEVARFSIDFGLDVAIEALRFARERKRISNREILHFARLLRQVRVTSAYLEGVTTQPRNAIASVLASLPDSVVAVGPQPRLPRFKARKSRASYARSVNSNGTG